MPVAIGPSRAGQSKLEQEREQPTRDNSVELLVKNSTFSKQSFPHKPVLPLSLLAANTSATLFV
jgi:hypothetical protein